MIIASGMFGILPNITGHTRSFVDKVIHEVDNLLASFPLPAAVWTGADRRDKRLIELFYSTKDPAGTPIDVMHSGRRVSIWRS